jgi:serine/threonine protein phosphatase PrpC
MGYRWWSSCRTSAGKRRKINEDAYIARPEAGLWVIADGMGGHTRGDVASRMVVDAFRHVDPADTMDEYIDRVRALIDEVHLAVKAEANSQGPEVIMGTTIVVFIACRNEYACLWAGDSRAYLLRDDKLQQLSHDHNQLQELIDRGEIDPDQIRSHPAARRITRAVGASKRLIVDEARGALRDRDTVILCSDGLTLEVEDGEIATVAESYDCDDASQELLDITLERGARDNVTLALIKFEETTRSNFQPIDITAVNYAFRNRMRAGASSIGTRSKKNSIGNS